MSTNKSQPKVSVIIPIYNTEIYLKRCIESVMYQTLKEIEIICIEDCSTDGSLAVLEELAKIDARIRIIKNKKNQGLSIARNKGIAAAGGEYIQFLDSDDYLIEDGLEIYYRWAKTYDLDVLKTGYELIEGGGKKVNVYNPQITQKIEDGISLLWDMMKFGILQWGAGVNFIKTDFIKQRGIMFCEGIYHEDLPFTYAVLMAAERVMCIDEAKYVYVKREGSITTIEKNIKHFYGCLVGLENIMMTFSESKNSKVVVQATLLYAQEVYRIADQYRKILGDIDISAWSPELQEWYQFLFGKQYIDYEKLNHILKDIKTARIIYIFGAGRAARQLLKWMDAREVAIDAVLVTEASNNSKTILGHRVLGVDEWQEQMIDKNAIVLVAVTEKRLGNATVRLKKYGFEQIINIC